MSSLRTVCDACVKLVSTVSIACGVCQAGVECGKWLSSVSTVCQVCQGRVECMKRLSSVSLSVEFVKHV